ncbi:uncharacterized protein LOC114365433 [Ostrinia furnacalis]|uniref:uncharacterized protein LOC114365433 n=1 Tax=Ostrinia furnacalis TaxID=93504 RepID=UPI00103DB36F|nr:uncharacterized protein LOC114365433 [Ostrinia furnacalis]
MHLASLDTDVSRTVGYVEHASPVIRSMDKYIYRRIGGNATIFLLLAFNGLVTLISMLTYIPRHPELAILRVLFFRYATIWNVIILLMYSALGFVCDFSIVQREENKVPSKIRELRYKVFHQLVFPCCVGFHNDQLGCPAARYHQFVSPPSAWGPAHTTTFGPWSPLENFTAPTANSLTSYVPRRSPVRAPVDIAPSLVNEQHLQHSNCFIF